MAIPPVPKKSFVEHIQGNKPTTPRPSGGVALARVEPKAEIVSRKKHRELQPWMVVTAAQAFKTGGTVKTVAALLNVTEARLSGWLAESESEGCEDELVLEFGHACLTARGSYVEELRGIVRVHALDDAKVAMQLLQAYDPEMNPAKKIEAKVQVDAAPQTERLDVLTDDELWAYRETLKKLGKG